MMKNPAKATEFYFDSRDRIFTLVHFEKRLANQAEGL
jgi:hypothetical protein